MAQSPQQITLYSDLTTSPVGQVTLIAGIQDGRGIVPATPYRIYGSYAIVYITQGQGTYRDSNGHTQAVRAGDMIFVFPELPHTYGPRPGETWSEFYVVFNGPAFETWRGAGLLSPRRPVIHVAPISEWVAKLEALTRVEKEAGKARQVCRLLDLLTEIVTGAGEAVVTSTPPDGSEWLARACSLLSERLEVNWSVAEFATCLGCSYETFRKRFTEELGLSPAHYRAARRLEVACDLLQYTSMTNAQIAARLAFSDEYHFSKRFKQLRGETPTQFRRRLWRIMDTSSALAVS